jgi:Cys-rich protein (TIGR01571 family)
MISGNQKVLMLILGLVLAFTFSVDASQVHRQDKDDVQVKDPVPSDADEDEETDATNQGPVYAVKTKDNNLDEKKEESKYKLGSKKQVLGSKKQELRLELASNLRKQSDFKQTIAHLTDQHKSDEEIEDLEKQVANETESAEMADMMGNMWKEMRMFEVPVYAKHVKHEVRHLKHAEKILQAKLKGEHVKETEEKEESEEKKEDEEEREDDGTATTTAAKTTKDDDQTSSVNFWKMSHRSQERVVTNTLVYLVFGILAAVLFKQMRSKYFEPEERLDANPTTKDFSFSVFGCLGDLKICALGFCCPCLAWANTLERRLKLPYWKAFGIFFGLMLLHAYTMGLSSIAVVALGVYHRQKLRESYGIDSYESGSKGTVAIDALLWCFCQPCAIVQEAREESAKLDKAGLP